MKMQNPFDITFGKRPFETISRFRQSSEILDTFRAPTITQQIYMITGVRGAGKTVLMNMIANTLEQDPTWIVVRLNPDRDLLSSLAAKLYSSQAGVQLFQNAKLNLSLFGFGAEVSTVPPVTDIEAAIEQMLKLLRQKKKRLLVTIDEVTKNDSIKAFCSSFQILIGEDLPIFLLMTGLYENIEELQNEKNLTFLYRAPKMRVDPLNLGVIASRYESIFSVDHALAKHMANLTKGYPFAFQALGFSAWNNGTEETAYMPEYRQLLEEYVYEKIWSELSPKDKRVIWGIARSSSGRIQEINQILNFQTDEINQYRKRLIRKGIVNGDLYGHLSFTLPCFSEFVLDIS